MATSIHDILSEFRAVSFDERDKGDRFERLMQAYLNTEPQYAQLYSDVWMWSDYPQRGNRRDTGIDLVARARDTGELTAIQCKFFDPSTTVTKPMLDSFLAASSKNLDGKPEFSARLVISTSDNWGRNAEDAVENQNPPVQRLRVQDLDESSIDWEQFSFARPGELTKKAAKEPFPHQVLAISKVIEGFQAADRGKLIMACGTGKTFTSLKLVEEVVPRGGTVLFLVPSISLLSQTLKEWTIESALPLRSFAVCSDVSVGKRKSDEDIPVTDLAYPATTNTTKLVQKFAEVPDGFDGITVVFSTYQSIDVVAQAQGKGIPDFDLIICDEAHRTTGVTLAGDEESAFVKVHNQDYIKAKKRLYMTATPRIYADASKSKAEEAGAVLTDMNNPAFYGEEFHRLGFGEAVSMGRLTDYKVLVLAVDESYISKRFQRLLADENNELTLDDAAKIVGCWNGLSKRSLTPEEFSLDPEPMKRAVAFARNINESKKIANLFEKVVEAEIEALDEDADSLLDVEVRHVDGTYNVLDRNKELDWLKQDPGAGNARILTNARVLSEGVDVPALDAVMFLNPRDSVVDVVQSVGRVMRKLEGKKYGYVILPIGVPADMDPATALNDNKKYKVVWQVLQALRAHDERFDAMVNKIDLTKSTEGKLSVIGVGGGGSEDGKDKAGDTSVTLDFPALDQWRDAILAKIVQKVGERRYWENWAKDVAGIASDHITRIRALVEGSDGTLHDEFARFLKGLQDNLNPFITERDAIEMLSQHLITKPVFDALFEGYAFSDHNPVSQVMQRMIDALEEQHLEKETEKLDKFYESVRTRAAGITDAAAKQQIVKELYEKFFQTAFSGTSDRLGIVYTPNEIVDFIIHSVDDALKSEFGASLSDEGVHVLDPFTGTGTFIVRLLQSGLIKPEDLARKYRYELHANELVLLAYYVAAINIEETFHALSGGDYEPFNGIVLTDTFQMNEANDELDGQGVFPENNERVEAQKALDIRVVIGNPPYSAGQESGNAENQNLKYPTLDARIAATYAARSTATLKNNLYDSYIRAIRWSSDRIGDKGIVAFVTNGGFIEGNTADGLRVSLAEEFDSIYVFNLRGNQRTAGEQSRREGGKVFGAGSRATVAVFLLVKRGGASRPAVIHYRDIGDYLSRDEKLRLVREARGLSGVDWQVITPNAEGDWVNQRRDDFAAFNPMESGSGATVPHIFHANANGIKTNRDAWVYSFSKASLKSNEAATKQVFNSEVQAKLSAEKAGLPWKRNNDPRKISWSDKLVARLERGRLFDDEPAQPRIALYRPFTRVHLTGDQDLIDRPSIAARFFPDGSRALGIAVPAPGNSAPPFMALVTDVVPDLGLAGISAVQFFPRHVIEAREEDDSLFRALDEGDDPYRRIDNVTDEILADYQKSFGPDVTKDAIFAYVYGVLHSPDYREQFGADLKKKLPRIPKVRAFSSFVEAGRQLMQLHLDYEAVEPYPLQEQRASNASYRVEKMKYSKTGRTVDKTKVIYNSGITLSGIPEEAQEYMLGSRSALDWVMERYQVKTDKASGIVNDPNDWAVEQGNPRYILDLLARIVTVSVETVKIVKSLPPLEILDA
ncbi:MAG: damage-inducible protein [Microbacterium sp.]|nr:damage-inducible protein [Microbacterium sp.]MBA4345068.1 damage-inducible protein [Microbacterium sp.]